MSQYYPVFLNIREKRCVVVGGGEVALRKVKVLLEYGADVMVVSPSACSELGVLADEQKIEILLRRYRTADLEGAFIVIAASDERDVNQAITSDAKRQKILVNVVDDPAGSDFIIPSSMSRGDLAVAVSTGGKSPALARKLKNELELYFGEEYIVLTELVAEVREELKNMGVKPGSDTWQKALDVDLLLDLLDKGQREKAKDILLTNLAIKR